MTLNDRIREDWGTATHFCKKHGINLNTFRVVIHGQGKSKPITDVLISYGYIRHADDIPQKLAGQKIKDGVK